MSPFVVAQGTVADRDGVVDVLLRLEGLSQSVICACAGVADGEAGEEGRGLAVVVVRRCRVGDTTNVRGAPGVQCREPANSATTGYTTVGHHAWAHIRPRVLGLFNVAEPRST